MRKVCSVDGCGSAVLARELCSKHYNRMLRKGSTSDERKNAKGTCSIEGCERPHAAFGRCDFHYRKTRPPRVRGPIDGRECAYCGGPISPGASIRAMFCSRDCKDQERIASGAARAATRRHYFRSQYGMTEAEVALLLEGQGGACAICRRTDWPGRHAVPVVDHDHVTGLVRGVLCSECNTGLGKFRDSVDFLRAAIKYLEAPAS